MDFAFLHQAGAVTDYVCGAAGLCRYKEQTLFPEFSSVFYCCLSSHWTARCLVLRLWFSKVGKHSTISEFCMTSAPGILPLARVLIRSWVTCLGTRQSSLCLCKTETLFLCPRFSLWKATVVGGVLAMEKSYQKLSYLTGCCCHYVQSSVVGKQ